MINKDKFNHYNESNAVGIGNPVTKLICWHCHERIQAADKLFWLGQRENAFLRYSVSKIMYFHEACFAEIAGYEYTIEQE